jgi:glycosyltransferase involved in cell wall biosynthesis
VRVPNVTLVHPVPMAYTFPVLRLLAGSGEIRLTVFYCRPSLVVRGEVTESAPFGFPHAFLADAGHVFVSSRNAREIDLNPGLPRALSRARPDLVVVSGFVQPTAVLGAAWAARHRLPYGLWVESHDLQRRPRYKAILRRRFAGPLVRHAALLLPTSEAAADSLDALGGDRTRMAFFPHVPDPTVFHAHGREDARVALRQRLGIDRDTSVIAFVGRLVETKGIEALLEAHREVHARTGARLVVVGSGPLGHTLGADGTAGVSLLGLLEPAGVAEVLRGADIAVSPSTNEPWGVAPLEAAASGCPVVATDVIPSAVDLVRRYGAGMLVPPGDPGRLATALLELIADPRALVTMSQRAADAAAAFTPERAARSFLDGVDLALAQRRSR